MRDALLGCSAARNYCMLKFLTTFGHNATQYWEAQQFYVLKKKALALEVVCSLSLLRAHQRAPLLSPSIPWRELKRFDGLSHS